ncbi:MAG: YciI family protein [Acidobacteriota bacterium]
MYAIAIVRYRRPLEDVLPNLDAHRTYLRGLRDAGTLLVSGPLDPRSGGVLLLRVPDHSSATLDRIRDEDPFVREGVAQYELLPWLPNIGADSLEKL